MHLLLDRLWRALPSILLILSPNLDRVLIPLFLLRGIMSRSVAKFRFIDLILVIVVLAVIG